jgi:hypothetical protein
VPNSTRSRRQLETETLLHLSYWSKSYWSKVVFLRHPLLGLVIFQLVSAHLTFRGSHLNCFLGRGFCLCRSFGSASTSIAGPLIFYAPVSEETSLLTAPRIGENPTYYRRDILKLIVLERLINLSKL